MIVDIPAYDKNFFAANTLVWGAYQGKLQIIFPVEVKNYLIWADAVTKNATIFSNDRDGIYVLPRTYMTRTGLIYTYASQYVLSKWNKTFVMAQSNSMSTEAKDLDAVYKSTAPFTPKANGLEYVAQDNPVVDILVTKIDLVDKQSTYIPVGGHVG